MDNPETQATFDIWYRTKTNKTSNTTQKLKRWVITFTHAIVITWQFYNIDWLRVHVITITLLFICYNDNDRSAIHFYIIDCLCQDDNYDTDVQYMTIL